MKLSEKIIEHTEKAIDRESFEMMDVPQDVSLPIQKEIAEINRLILIMKNYGATAPQIEEIREGVLDKIEELDEDVNILDQNDMEPVDRARDTGYNGA